MEIIYEEIEAFEPDHGTKTIQGTDEPIEIYDITEKELYKKIGIKLLEEVPYSGTFIVDLLEALGNSATTIDYEEFLERLDDPMQLTDNVEIVCNVVAEGDVKIANELAINMDNGNSDIDLFLEMFKQEVYKQQPKYIEVEE